MLPRAYWGMTRPPFLRRLGRQEQIKTFACFAAALRKGGLDTRRIKTDRPRHLSGTIRAALDKVAQACRLNTFESPIHDNSGRLEPVLALQLRATPTRTLGLNNSRRCHWKSWTERDE